MSPERQQHPGGWRSLPLVPIACVVVVAAVTFLAFVPALGAEWLNWDDDRNFLENPDWRGLQPANVKWMFTAFYVGHYQPLSWLTLALDFTMWGGIEHPGGFHLTNVILHVANAALFFFLVRALLTVAGPDLAGRRAPALDVCAAFGALFFAVHPLRVENVAWITERRDVLSTLFLLAALLAYLAHARRHGRRWLAVSLVFYALSLLSKAMGITFPAVLLVLDLYPLRRLPANPARWFTRAGRGVLLEKVPFALLAAAIVVVAFLAQHYALASLERFSALERALVVAYALTFYPMKTLVPAGLIPLYEMPLQLSGIARTCLISGAAALAVTLVLFVLRRRAPYALVAWIIYLVVLSPVSGVAPSGPQLVADRYAYVACTPFAVLPAALLLRILLPGAPGRRRSFLLPGAACLVATAVVCVLGVLTFRYTTVWQNSVSLWRHTLRYAPNVAKAHFNLGRALYQRGDDEEGFAHIRRAIELRPGWATARNYNNIGNALRAKGDLEGAIAAYQKAIQMEGGFANAHYNLGNVFYGMRRMSEAAASYERAVAADPGHPNAWFNLGNARAMSGDLGGAIDAYRQALRVNPADADAQERLQWCLSQAAAGR